MPLSQYDKYFGGTRGDAEKALASMRKTYGPKKGEHVFYASIAKKERRAKRTRGKR